MNKEEQSKHIMGMEWLNQNKDILYASDLLDYISKLQKENEELKRAKEQSQEILSSIKIVYQIHTKDCELLLKDIKKWEKILDK